MARLRELKSRAQLLQPALRLGRSGLTAEFLAALEEALQHSGLVKIRFEDFKDQRKPLSAEIASRTSSLLIQQVGHTAVFYRDAVGSSSCSPTT
ncbi:MAG: hypothetical protein Fur0032_15160 [Terrimicrobiaceae bacterium]